MRFIYRIQNTASGKCYIGQSADVARRWAGHLFDAFHENAQRHRSAIASAIQKYGQDHFTFDVIEECEDHLANEREVFWIGHFHSFGDGYNMTSGGECFELSPESKKKIGDAHRGRSLTEEHKKKLAKSQMGKVPTQETLAKRSRSLKGRKISEEHKARISECHTGKIVSVETREKLSKAGLGRIVSDETKHKIREAKKKETDEARKSRGERISAAKRGKKRKPFTDEHRQKLRDAALRRRLLKKQNS